MLFFEISIFVSDVFVSKNRLKGHGICLFFGHEKSWNLIFQKVYEPCIDMMRFENNYSFGIAPYRTLLNLSLLLFLVNNILIVEIRK